MNKEIKMPFNFKDLEISIEDNVEKFHVTGYISPTEYGAQVVLETIYYECDLQYLYDYAAYINTELARKIKEKVLH